MIVGHKPILARGFGRRGQVDLIDFQSCPDGTFKFLLNYQDHGIKFHVSRALTSKRDTATVGDAGGLRCRRPGYGALLVLWPLQHEPVFLFQGQSQVQLALPQEQRQVRQPRLENRRLVRAEFKKTISERTAQVKYKLNICFNIKSGAF